MKKAKKYNFIEYLYPREHFKLIIRIIIVLLITLALIGALIYIIMLFLSREPIAMVAALIIFLCLLHFTVFIMLSVYKETYAFLYYPFTGYKNLAKVFMNRELIILYFSKRPLMTFKWDEVVLIEKFREFNENLILIMKLDILDKTKRDERNKNYIELPSRYSIENAINKFSNREISIRKTEI